MKKSTIYTICGLLFLGIIGIGLLKVYLRPAYVKPVEISKTVEQPVKTTKDYISEALSRKYSKTKEDVTIEVQTEIGNFAKGSVNFNNEPVGGGLWFAVRRSGGWEVVFDGNGIMPCYIANDNDLPVEMVPGCVDTGQDNSFVERK